MTAIRSLVLPFALVLSLVLIGCSAEEAGDAGDSEAETRGTPVAAVEIQPRNLSRELAFSATVEAKTRIRLASQTAGIIDSVQHDVGDRVERGEPMVQLELSEAQAELRRAEAEEADARLSYQRARELRDQNAISAAEYERDQVALAVAESRRQLWEARVAFGRVTAPVDGIVSARYVEPGEAVDARDVLFELVVLDDLVLRPGISEMDVAHLEVGQPVPVRFDAAPDLNLEAKVRRIHPTAAQDSRQIRVEIALPQEAAAAGIRPGYLARVRMPIDIREDRLAVPAGAIGEDGDDRYVYVIADDQLEQRRVETGATRGQWTEVLDGLEEGEIVLATNPIDMRAGERVRIVGWRG